MAKMLIGGELVDSVSKDTYEVRNPATGAVVDTAPKGNEKDILQAIQAAETAFKEWSDVTAEDRGNTLMSACELIKKNSGEIAQLLTQEQGKIIAEARLEVLVTADIIEWYAEEGRRAYGRIVPGRMKGVRQLVVQEPVGICVAFTPWNFPTLTPARKIGGALAAGCSLILKASEETPGSCVELVRCFVDAGLPAGVLNLVFGVPSNVSEHLIASD